MVRVAIVALALSGCMAEDDVYYHTQLLQTKVNPQKVAVDTTGDVQDDLAFFQKSFAKKLHRNSKKAAQTKFFAAMKGLRVARQGPNREGGKEGKGGSGRGEEPPPRGAGGEGPPPPPAEAEQQCRTYYGVDVDVDKCWSCAMQAMMADDGSGWHPDPNVGFERMCDSVDECMGEVNHLTNVCEENYGEEVGLLDCLVCGMMCECPSPTDCDMTCHQGCMSLDAPAWEEEEPADADEGCGLEECKMFYGDDVSEDKCKECGEKCFEEAMGCETPEDFFTTMISCSDACMGKKNVISQQCEAGYGPDVDVFACFNCGMMCDCSAEQCDMECHGGCMGGGDSSWETYTDMPTYDSTWATYTDTTWPTSYSSTYTDTTWPTSYSSSPTYAATYTSYGSLLQASKAGKVPNLKLSSALRLYAKNAQRNAKAMAKSDVTDLMQTSKHLK